MSESNTSPYLLFTLMDSTYAIDLQQVAEVVEPPPLSPIPRAPAHLIGAMNSHGNIKAVVDLSLMLNQGHRKFDGKILVLEDRFASLAIWVDGVLAIAATETMERKPTEEDDELSDWIISDGTQVIRLLALDKLLQRLEATING
ncbi:scaffold protein CheW associated with MCPs of class 44H [Geotalea daltonii FRC-32]|uniref:Scaffold protein CheW associated with MCPs of class 44H n=1 Tax=Geotalea daltonii (strain DSM 22248 / JCM 15807 / FRC-32) TaxID=316067 RepID=B9M1Z1_GEODF|nr:chemotaxis protein CheW [Geotalea daltonii]ACM19287.1 scaffold protein CheW associated with MCPs of class 44H [Geotalea daltonii FRC-32]